MRDVFTLIGQTGNGIGRNRSGSLTSFLHTIVSPLFDLHRVTRWRSSPLGLLLHVFETDAAPWIRSETLAFSRSEAKTAFDMTVIPLWPARRRPRSRDEGIRLRMTLRFSTLVRETPVQKALWAFFVTLTVSARVPGRA